MKGFYSIFFFCLLIGFCSLLNACKEKEIEGEKLAKVYCASCHQLPNPNLLPKNVWQHGTLPNMAIYLGIKKEIAQLKKPIADNIVLQPSEQMISDADWEKIKDYYLSNAPKKLDLPAITPLKNKENLFDVESIRAKNPKGTLPNFTFVGIDTRHQRIMAADQTNKTLWIIDKNGKPMQEIKNQNAITNIDFSNANKQDYFLTYIGSTTQPNPEIIGSAQRANITDKDFKINQILLPNLNRSTHVLEADLDNDKLNELISCEYGFIKGKLSVWTKKLKSNYQEEVLSYAVGAMKTMVLDFDGDKKLDIIAQFAQGDERIVFYKNKGKLNFEAIELLRFPPSYGSSSFDVVDINQDKHLDIVYTAGDNADFSTVLKPYHGVYVFQNNGKNQFKQSYFYYQNGSYKAIARDFDNDGDIDIVSISMFPDVTNHPLEGFIYHENKDGNFTQTTMTISHFGRWNVIDANDLDNDGDIDLVLGSHPVAPFPSGFDQNWKNGSGLLILRNKTKKSNP